jgi:hypothetical protein
MTNSEKKYHRSELARQQLKTAIMLLLNEKDLSSVITLSAAASNILSQLVLNSGKEPFVDLARRVFDAHRGHTPKREHYKNHITNILGVNIHKHMSPNCPKTCTLDLQQCAIDSVTAAIGDYVSLYGQNDDFVRAYFSWKWVRQDGEEIIALYNSMPDKLKKTEKWCANAFLENLKKKNGIKQVRSEKKAINDFN